MTAEEIQMEAQKWLSRCQKSAIIAFGLWLAWVIVSQVLKDVLPASLYMMRSDDAALTGW